jgi:hypothetical protein
MVLSNRIDTGSAAGGLISSRQFPELIADLQRWRTWAGSGEVGLLRRISLTGADDAVSLEDLRILSAAYARVEWALLYVPHAEGKPRNPTRSWREAFFAAGLGSRAAVHLCGEQAFRELLAGELPSDILKADRLQLNINARKRDFTDAEVLEVFRTALELGPSLILQYHPDSAALIERAIAECPVAFRHRLHVLMDASRGTGVVPDIWSAPSSLDGAYCGFAGGLGPDNIADVATQLSRRGVPYWLDMESGLRTENQFDMAKVRAVLARTDPF